MSDTDNELNRKMGYIKKDNVWQLLNKLELQFIYQLPTKRFTDVHVIVKSIHFTILLLPKPFYIRSHSTLAGYSKAVFV